MVSIKAEEEWTVLPPLEFCLLHKELAVEDNGLVGGVGCDKAL